MKTLGGATFVWRGNDQDYCFKETITCLADLCDELVVGVGGPDGTVHDVDVLLFDLRVKYPNKIIEWFRIWETDWNEQKGREKLSYFSNKAIDRLSTDWVFYLQCDEVLHEDSFPNVRYAIEQDAEAFFCQRLNLWKTPWQMLNVPQERKPCSTEVIRLAKTQYRCVDDAESLGVPVVHMLDPIDSIQIFHMGFVRDPVKHLEKIRHMQTEVFLWGDYDEKAKNCDRLMPDRWFSPETDLIPIPKPLPKFIQAWAKERYP